MNQGENNTQNDLDMMLSAPIPQGHENPVTPDYSIQAPIQKLETIQI